MNKYTITFKGHKANIPVDVAYGESGKLRSLDFGEQEISSEALTYCYNKIPAHESDLGQIGFLALVEAVPQDLSFTAFWEKYGYKIGNKTRAMKEWTALNTADRIKCLRAIPQYHQYLKNKPNIDRLYPETFLHQRRFENQFKL